MRRRSELIPEYSDFSGHLALGSADGHMHPYDPLEEDVIAWEKELKEREARRIPPGFQLPEQS